MSRIAIIDTATGAILVLDPPTREDGSVILPEGIAAEVVTLTPEQEAQIQADADAAVAARAAEATAASTLRQQIIDQAQSAVGVALSALTATQRNALTAILLWESGGVANDMTVRPLNEWAKAG